MRVLRDESAVVLHRQPIIDLRRGVTAGFELLARFADREVDAPPHHWFGAAYRLGLGPQLESAVLRRALRLRDEAPPNTFVTVNLDPAALAVPEIGQLLLGEARLHRLVIELTEHTEVDDIGRLGWLLDRLRERGALVAVDDAGTGYASLARLLAVRPQFVKIDQAFVRGIAEDPAKRALVELVGHFASRVDAWVIAEGIETAEDLDEVVRLGVPLGQGFLLNPPAADFQACPAGVREQLARLAGDRDAAAGLGRLAEPVSCVPLGDHPGDGGGNRLAVLVDAHGRPVRVWLRGRVLPAMAATAACDPVDVALRAMVRPTEERFAPVVVTGEDGRPVGIVRMERLVTELAQRARGAVPGQGA